MKARGIGELLVPYKTHSIFFTEIFATLVKLPDATEIYIFRNLSDNRDAVTKADIRYNN